MVVLIWSTGLLVGQQTWKKTFGGSGSDVGHSITPTADGGYVMTGFTESNDGDFEGMSKGSRDIIVVKLDSRGNVLWKKTIGGSEWDSGTFITTTSDGGYVVTGLAKSNDGDFEGMSRGDWDIFVIRLDSLGDVLLKRTYGGSQYDAGKSIILTSDGEYVVTGRASSTKGDFEGLSKGGEDIFIMKLDASGDVLWKKIYGGSGNDEGTFITPTSDGGYVLTGYAQSNDGDFEAIAKGLFDIIVIRLDSRGDVVWKKAYGGSGFDFGHTITPKSDGGYVLSGVTDSDDSDFEAMGKGANDIFVIKLDSHGDILWKKTYGGSSGDRALSSAPTADGGFILTGYSGSNDVDFDGENRGSEDIFVIRLDSSGDVQWKKTYGGSESDWGWSIAPTPDRGYVLTGLTSSNDGDFVDMNKGKHEIFVIKLDSNGNLNPTTSIEEPSDLSYSFRVTPNPLSSVSYASYTIDNSSRVRIELVNSMGEVVSVLSDRPEDRGSHRLPINTAGLIAGAYTLRMIANGHVVSRRVVLVK